MNIIQVVTFINKNIDLYLIVKSIIGSGHAPEYKEFLPPFIFIIFYDLNLTPLYLYVSMNKIKKKCLLF